MALPEGKNPARGKRTEVARVAVAALGEGRATLEATLTDTRVVTLDMSLEELEVIVAQAKALLPAAPEPQCVAEGCEDSPRLCLRHHREDVELQVERVREVAAVAASGLAEELHLVRGETGAAAARATAPVPDAPPGPFELALGHLRDIEGQLRAGGRAPEAKCIAGVVALVERVRKRTAEAPAKRVRVVKKGTRRSSPPAATCRR